MRKFYVITVFLLFAGIAFGQTLQKGDLVSVHNYTVTLNPGATMNQYWDTFANKWVPELNKHFEGVKFFALKGDRRVEENNIGLLVWCESIETRDRYWPEDGVPSEDFNSIAQKLQTTLEELGNLGSYTDLYTEWLIE